MDFLTQSTVGLYLNDKCLKAITVNRRKNKFINPLLATLPENIISNAQIIDEDLIIEHLREKFKFNKFLPLNFKVGIHSENFFFKYLLLPDMPLHHLRKSLQWEVQKYYSQEILKDSIIDFSIVGTEERENALRRRILLAVVPKEIIRGLHNLFSKAKLRLEVIDIVPLALQRALLPNIFYKNYILLHFEENQVFIKIIINSELEMHKVVSFFLTSEEKVIMGLIDQEVRAIEDYFNGKEITLEKIMVSGVKNLRTAFLTNSEIAPTRVELLQTIGDHLDSELAIPLGLAL